MIMADQSPKTPSKKTSHFLISTTSSTNSTPLETASEKKGTIPLIHFLSILLRGLIKSGVLSESILKGLLRIVPQDAKHQHEIERKSMYSKATSRASSKGLKFKRILYTFRPLLTLQRRGFGL